MAERSLLFTSILVIIALLLCGVIYFLVSTIDYSGSSPMGSITKLTTEDMMSNDYLLTVGGLSRGVKLSDVKLNVLDQITPDTIDNYVGPDHQWYGSEFAFYFIDTDNSSSLTNGDGLRIRVIDVEEWMGVECNLIYIPTGATLVNVVFLAMAPFDLDQVMYYDFSSETFKDLSGHQADAVPNPGWAGPYYGTSDNKSVLAISKDKNQVGRYLSVAYNQSLDLPSRMLVQMRVTMTSDPNIASDETMLLQRGPSWSLGLGSVDLIRGRDYRFGIILGMDYYEIGSKTKVVEGEWHTISASYDSTTGLISLYIDGIREDSQVVKGHLGIYPSISPLTIGSNVQTGPWEGMIAYVTMSGE